MGDARSQVRLEHEAPAHRRRDLMNVMLGLVDVLGHELAHLLGIATPRRRQQPPVRRHIGLTELVARRSGPGFANMIFTTGGSEAVESALKVALHYHYAAGAPTRRQFIARGGAAGARAGQVREIRNRCSRT